jgi:2-succinyl-6-hydroxy-2,4-cyclohexadiene-1-carboxylate synthase
MNMERITEKYVPIRGVNYHIRFIERNPANPWLIMLHGFLGSGAQFMPVAGRITDSVNICLPDLTGFGKTDVPLNTDRYTAEEQVSDFFSILDTTLSGRIIILHGYSMGGRLACRIASAIQESRDPARIGRFAGLIMESSSPGIRDEDERRKRVLQDSEMARHILTDFPGFLREWSARPLFRTGRTSGLINRIQLSTDPQGAASSLAGFGNGSLKPVWDKLPEFSFPVLIVAGELDYRYCGIARETAVLLNDAELKIIPGSGHRVHIDNPDGYISAINDWVEKLFSS